MSKFNPMKKIWTVFPSLSLLIFYLSSCVNTAPSYRMAEGMAWNTMYHITYESDKNLEDSILAVFNIIDNSVSAFNENSTVSKINRNESSVVDSHFRRVYEKSKEVSEASGGMFDPTLAPLIKAWGFGKGHTVSADTLRLDSLLAIVGLSKTRLQGDTLIKENPEIQFNFSAIAKGYGVDCMAEMLERNGVKNYLVEIGGEIRAMGVNQHGKLWTIGIDRPEPDEVKSDGSPLSIISLSDIGMATSGNYRNYQTTTASGSFGHTISPLTGHPVDSGLAAVTIIAPTCMEADALATTCMVIGLEKGLALCQVYNVAALFITKDMEVVTNDIFRQIEKTGHLSDKSGSLEKQTQI